MSTLDYSITELFDKPHIQFKTNSSNITLEIECSDCKKHSKTNAIKCDNIDAVQLNIILQMGNKLIEIFFNASCKPNQLNSESHFAINTKIDSKTISVSWQSPSINIIYYLLYLIDNTGQYIHRIINTNSFLFDNLNEKSWYEICIATINYKWITSRFTCKQILTDFFSTGPVTNINVTAHIDKIYLSWDKPEYKHDIPQGYIVQIDRKPSIFCHTIIINMGKFQITNTAPHCGYQKHKIWTKLVPLKIDNLPPNLGFTISITPINNNKHAFTKERYVRTKGSETVRQIKIKGINAGYLGIELGKPYQPSQQNEKTELEQKWKYRIRIILIKNNYCTNDKKYEIVHEEITEKLINWIKINVFKECSSYFLEIFPINISNNEVGESASISFQYPLDRQKHQISVNTQFVSQNLIVIHLNQSQNNNQCEKEGIIVEIINENDPSDCSIKAFTNIYCERLINKVNKMCPQNVVFDIKSSTIKTVHLGINQYSKKYKYKISQITEEINIINSGNIEDNTITDCFTDCYNKNSVYPGIRSADKNGNICKEWKYSIFAYYKNTKSNICLVETDSYPWCPVDNKSWFCDIPQCLSIHKATGCVEINKKEILSDSLIINWSALKYQDEIIGYATLLHNIDYICQQYHIQLCHNCNQSENQLENRIKNIYLSCKSGHVDQTIKYETKFKDLHQNHKYFIYIIPIIDKNMIGEVRNITIHTKLAKPAVPQNIYSNNQLLNSIELSWDKQNNFTKYGPSNQYQIVIRNSNSNQTKSIISNQERIEIPNLEMCTSYCFTLRSVNDAGESEWSKEQCYYTLAPKAGNVEIENIESGYFTSRTLRWKYLGGDICERKYRLEYQVKHTNEINYLITNETIETINNLKRNVNYTIQIRAENKMKTENNEIIGQYSNKKQFYTGLVFVNISNYNDAIISESDDKSMNISWNINEDVKGSLFQFIIVVKNSTNMCIYAIDMQCDNCESPWNLNSLSMEERESRNKLLKCDKKRYQKFKNEDLNFNYLLESEIKLNNYSVEIFGINLLGVHQLNRKITIIPINSGVNKVAIIIVFLILIVILIGILLVIFQRKRGTLFNYRKESENKFNLNPNKKSNSFEHHKSNYENQEMKENYTSEISPKKPKVQEKKKSTAINISDFIIYYERVTQNANADIIKEYKKLGLDSKVVEANLKLTVDAGKESQNTKRNRFINILPFDQNRVKVGNRGYPNDYINASYIPFLNNDKKIEYIAAQGPIDGSLSDFWQMIWEQNIKCIVMLTQTMEADKFKCLQYWPESLQETANYGDKEQYCVELIEENEFEGHIERKFIVKNLDTNEERNILHLHMHTWFDHSAPNLDYFDKLLFRFQEIVTSNSNYPYLVHCSAGVGRTGTLICLDRIIKDLVSGGQEINIYETVLKLRHYRNFIVQRQAQYIFIHDYLNHFISKYMKIEGNEETLYFNEEDRA